MVKELIKSILNYSCADQMEVLYSGGDTTLTRFANNYIHQNVAERDASVSIRVVIGKKSVQLRLISLKKHPLSLLLTKRSKLPKLSLRIRNSYRCLKLLHILRLIHMCRARLSLRRFKEHKP